MSKAGIDNIEKIGMEMSINGTPYPTAQFFSMLHGKRKFQILYELTVNKTLRFVELKKNIEKMTANVLSSALKEMLEDELITREQFNEIPPRVEYSLTEKGRALLPILNEIIKWEKNYN